jgi:hypothetical protein
LKVDHCVHKQGVLVPDKIVLREVVHD